MTGLIDVHHHYLSQAYIDAVGEEAVSSPGSAGKVDPWTAELSLEFMDMAGIAAAVLSATAPGIPLPPEAAARVARMCNEEQAGMVRAHPKRFGFLAIPPMPDIDASLREVEYALDTLHADGVVLMSNYGGDYAGCPQYWPLFEELNRRKAVVLVHPTLPLNYRGFPGVSMSTMEFPFDTARAIASMLYNGTPEKFPNIRFIWTHAGGAMPMIAGRMAVLSQRNKNFKLSGEKLMPALARFHYDVTQSLSPPAYAALSALAPTDHLLFGSDCPMAREPQIRAQLADIARLPQAARAGIERANALALFPRFA
ncbi:MAG: amidohydrolase [Alphaproteobacteria bacterium]|nr:amidohydrolase [Alphaproteobacteria bacterium]